MWGMFLIGICMLYGWWQTERERLVLCDVSPEYYRSIFFENLIKISIVVVVMELIRRKINQIKIK